MEAGLGKVSSVSTSVGVGRAISVSAETRDFATDLASVEGLAPRLRPSTWSPINLLRLRPSGEHPRPLTGRPLRYAVGGRSKRAMDLLIALPALLLLAPLLGLVALGIRASLGSPILYKQRRVGFAGRSFLCYKFRTMVVDADEVLRRHLESHPQAAREWLETQKLKDDPRVTPLGNLLRKSSIDELPQLFNVLRGDMSCIGPRPVVPGELERYQAYAHEYMAARPGLTGLWQVNGRNRLSYRNRVALDRVYVRRCSLRLDLMILLRTIPAVLRIDETS